MFPELCLYDNEMVAWITKPGKHGKMQTIWWELNDSQMLEFSETPGNEGLPMLMVINSTVAKTKDHVDKMVSKGWTLERSNFE